MTLDPSTKQCVTPRKPAPATEDVTGSISTSPLPTVSTPTFATIPVQPRSDEHQIRSTPPVEPDAVIHAELRQDVELMFELVHYVRASGYRCASISALKPLSYSKGFKLVCDHFNFRYAIEDKGGRTTVTIQ